MSDGSGKRLQEIELNILSSIFGTGEGDLPVGGTRDGVREQGHRAGYVRGVGNQNERLLAHRRA